MKWIIRGRTLPKTILISIAVVALIVTLVVMPWNFEIQADGKLEPVNQSDVFARVGGKIRRIEVKHDDAVAIGQSIHEGECEFSGIAACAVDQHHIRAAASDDGMYLAPVHVDELTHRRKRTFCRSRAGARMAISQNRTSGEGCD
jgi:hypothetical protein